MSATLLPVAHHSLVAALPFVVPMLAVVGALAFLVARDRLTRGSDRGRGQAPNSTG